MKRTYSLIILVVVLCFAGAILASCTPSPKTIEEIYIISAVDEDVQQGDFDIANYRIRLIMSDGTDKYVRIKEHMISTNLAIFEEIGEQTLSLVYNNNILTLKINIVDRVYAVTFDVNGGSALSPRSSAKIMARPLTSKDGFKFAGWYTTQDFSGPQVLFPFSVVEDITLYANWVADTITVYEVEFDFNYGEAIAYTSQLIPDGAKAVEPTFIERDGYSIAGWYLGDTLWDYDENTVEANITLEARWVEV